MTLDDLHKLDGQMLRKRIGGYLVRAHARPYGLLLIAEPKDNLRNWTVTLKDAPRLCSEWNREDGVALVDPKTITPDELWEIAGWNYRNLPDASWDDIG